MKANLEIIKILKFQGETKQGPAEILGMKTFLCPSSLEGTDSTLPDPLSPKQQIQMAANQGREEMQKQRRDGLETLVQQ